MGFWLSRQPPLCCRSAEGDVGGREATLETTVSCSHRQYCKPRYVTSQEALREMRRKNSSVCWMSRRIEKCASCGADISHLNLVEVKGVKEYFDSLGLKPPKLR